MPGVGTKSTSNRRVAKGVWRTALVLYQEFGWTIGRIAQRFHCNYYTVQRHLRMLGAERPRSPDLVRERAERRTGTRRRSVVP